MDFKTEALLSGDRFFCGDDVHSLTATPASGRLPHVLKLNDAGNARVKCVIGADPNVEPGVKLGAVLPHKNLAGFDVLASVTFYTQPLTGGVSSVG